jgi:uncharacterized membrane protein YgcG
MVAHRHDARRRPRHGPVLAVLVLAVLGVALLGGVADAQTTPTSSICDLIPTPAVRQQCLDAIAGLPTPPTLPNVAVPSTPSIPGVEHIAAYAAVIRIEPTGALLVREQIRYDFGVVPHHGIFRDIPVRFDYPRRTATDRVYPLAVVSVSASSGTPAQYTTDSYSSNGVGYERIKIGDPNRTITGSHSYTIAYRVRGVLNGFANHDELVWNAVGGQWTVPIQHVTVQVQTPAAITGVNCSQGPTGSSLPCAGAQANGTTASFSQPTLDPMSGVTVSVAIPTGAVPTPKPILEQRRTLGRAFAVTPVTAGTAGGLLLLFIVGFLAAMWLFGRDRRYRGSAVDQSFGTPDGTDERAPLFEHTETPVEFVPPDGLRPGQIGTLVGFRAHPLDVTATIIDLAVRKYLLIEEVDPETHSRWLKQDWKLTKLKAADDQLKPYERRLFNGLLKGGDHTNLSALREHFATTMNKVEEDLLDDAMQQSWFRRKPESVWLAVGAIGVLLLAVGVGLTIALALTTHAALVGIPFIVLGLLVTIGARWAPSRTAKGSAVLRHVNGFRRFINESEKNRAQFAEQKNLFSEYLPYAIVFGATEKWAKAFADLGGEPADTASWYRSSVPFQYLAFSSAIQGFTVTASGTLTSTPPSTSGASGFGGGGFSGGGAGGGGGGSW